MLRTAVGCEREFEDFIGTTEAGDVGVSARTGTGLGYLRLNSSLSASDSRAGEIEITPPP